MNLLALSLVIGVLDKLNGSLNAALKSLQAHVNAHPLARVVEQLHLHQQHSLIEDNNKRKQNSYCDIKAIILINKLIRKKVDSKI